MKAETLFGASKKHQTVKADWTKPRIISLHLLYWHSIRGNIEGNGLWPWRDVQIELHQRQCFLNFPSWGITQGWSFSPSSHSWSPLPLHLNFTQIPKGDVYTSGCLYSWCMRLLVYFHSWPDGFFQRPLPSSGWRQIWQELCDARPAPTNSATCLGHHKFDYCLYYH